MVATAEWVHWYGHHPATLRRRHANPRRARSRLGTRPPPPRTITTGNHRHQINQPPQNPGLDNVGRHVVVLKITSVDADDPDQAEHEHSPLLVTGDKETRRPAPVEAHQVIHHIRRWLTQVEAAFRQRYPAPALPWKSPAPRGVRGSVRSPREHGSIDVPGTRFPTAPSEMIGPEQREQTMFT